MKTEKTTKKPSKNVKAPTAKLQEKDLDKVAGGYDCGTADGIIQLDKHGKFGPH